MLEQSPEIVERKTELGELRDALAIATAPISGDPIAAAAGKRGTHARSDETALRERIAQKEMEPRQAIHEQIRVVARFFVAIDAGYKQLPPVMFPPRWRPRPDRLGKLIPPIDEKVGLFRPSRYTTQGIRENP